LHRFGAASSSQEIALRLELSRGNRSAADLLLLGTVALITLSCGGGGGGDKNTPTALADNSVASVSVTPNAPLGLVSGQTATLTATAQSRNGGALAGQVATWISTDSTIANVVGGVVTARLVGSASITAQVGGISSAPIGVTVSAGAPTQLGVRTPPGGAASGLAFTSQPVVEVRDAAGNLVPSSTLAVTAALGTGGGTLTGATTVNATAGVAAFSGLTITGTVGSRTLTFSATGLSPVTSVAFTLTPGAATQLAIGTQPVAGTAYAPFTTPATVNILDGAGNLVTASTLTVTCAIASGSGALGGAVSVAAVAGIATFLTLTVNGTAGARTLTFSSGTLQSVTSASFNVAAAPPAVIAFSPATAAIGATNGVNPAAVNVTVTNTGVFPLTNLRVQSVTYNPLLPTTWLAASFPSGSDAPATLRLTATSATLALGTYTAVVVLAGDGTAATASLTVTLTVAAQNVNTFGTSANKVSIVTIGSAIAPGLVTTSGANGAVTTTDPTLAFVGRSPAIATVDPTGRITAVASGQAWVVATSTQNNADSVLVIVPANAGLVLRTNLTRYGFHVGDTIIVHVQVDTRGASVGAATVTLSWPFYTGSTGVFGALTFIDISSSASPLAPVTTVDQSVNVIRITGASTGGASGLVELAVVRFRVAKSATSAFYVNAVELLGTDFSNLLPTATFTQYPVIVP
jgi:hypothetical protein